MKELKAKLRKFKRNSSTSSSKGLYYQKREVKRQNIKPSIIRQAEELRSRLEANYPCFIKPMLKSHVASCFWMGLPVPFCKMYLPQNDTYFILENQYGKKYRVKYLARKTALSGGWRGFSIAEELSQGDVLVFHLIQPTKFKVYVLRSDLTENDKPRVIQNLPAEVVQRGLEVGTLEPSIETHRPSSISEDDSLAEMSKSNRKNPSQKDVSKSNSGTPKHVLYPDAVGDGGIASFDEFVILLEDLLKKEYDLPHNLKHSYYKLCCSQNEFLHIHLLEGINPFLIAGIIIETVNVALAMKSLGFLVSHLDNLQRVAYDPEATRNRQQYLELCSEHAISEREINNVEAKLSELIGVFDKRADEIKKLKSEIKNHKSKFLEQEQLVDAILINGYENQIYKPNAFIFPKYILFPEKDQTFAYVFPSLSDTIIFYLEHVWFMIFGLQNTKSIIDFLSFCLVQSFINLLSLFGGNRLPQFITFSSPQVTRCTIL
ncbi:B3 domain-containing protein Os01g0234100 isoform X3 [Beta vulgaris subsp. vulgaris]|uniref:B3 domain-containing protein Os01g0234100 isoform X3 n=1 Tax=Beta vulgaris subsp. vulgaris TaxID=3555 RepID=UPI0020367FD9|nr:B3 domain-containing protein Os01g0234100 isoform X3 [Beta vulgaris subsp. vulgaris]